MIEIRDLSFSYDMGTSFEVKALSEINLVVPDGSFMGIAGGTGSGKSTLIRHLNCLLRPKKGTVLFNGEDVNSPDYDRRALRGKVGLVLQYPEHQLFEETVLRDVMFGPLNLGRDESRASELAKKALSEVGLGDECHGRSPFNLSGGEKRRVALAGVLAMEPQVLVLDEPAAGLDPHSHDELFSLLHRLNDGGRTIVVVSHSMEDIAEHCSSMVLLRSGHVADQGSPVDVFRRNPEFRPAAMRLSQRLLGRTDICTMAALVEQLKNRRTK